MVSTRVTGLADQTDVCGAPEKDDLDPVTAVEDVDRPSGARSDLGDSDEVEIELELLHHQPLDRPMPLQTTDLEIQGLPAVASIVTATSHLELSPVEFRTLN